MNDLLHQGTGQRVALHLQGNLPLQAVGQPLTGGVEGDNEHPSLAAAVAALLQRLNGPKGGVVVLAVDGVDLWPLALAVQPLAGDLVGLGLGEVAVQLSQEGPVFMGLDGLLQTGAPAQLGAGAQGALDVQDVDRPVRVLEGLLQPGRGLLSLPAEVGAHVGGIEAVVRHLDGAVHQNDGNPRRLGLLKHRVPAGDAQGHEEDAVHLLLDELADGGDLVLLLLAGVLKEEVIARLLREHGADGFGVGHPEAGLRPYLTDPDDQELRGGLRLWLSGLPKAAGGQQEQAQEQGNKLFHTGSSFLQGMRTLMVVPIPS